MDTENLKHFAEERFNHELYRKNLRERVDGQLCVTHNGHIFKATQTLIAFLSVYTDDEMYLEDEHRRPALVKRLELLTQLKEAYQFAMNAWHVEYSDASKIRKGKNV